MDNELFEDETELEEPVDPTPKLTIDAALRVNFATAQNAVPILRSICVENPSDKPLTNVTVTMHPHPAFCREKTWTIDRVPVGDIVAVADRDLSFDLPRLAGLNEAEHGELLFTLDVGTGETLQQSLPVELLARDEWGGLADMSQILAAFVSPNDPAIPKILRAASRLLAGGGHKDSMEGYQSGDPRRVYMIAAAIWSALTGMGLTYANPPRSFEIIGQKVRDPGRIESEGLATCLDTVLLSCAALEAAGLNPVVVFTSGHAFCGIWLVDRSFGRVSEPDITELRKAIAAREFVVFETTLLTSRPPVGFDQAVSDARGQLSEERETDFNTAIDIARARNSGIRPLASHRVTEVQDNEAGVGDVAAAALPKIPDFGLLPGEYTDEEPTTPAGRVERWQRKLLDLSLRNRLLNFKLSKQSVPFLCPNISGLEDHLADGGRMRVVSLDEENPVGERDPELFRQQTGTDIQVEYATAAQERGEICVPLTATDMKGRLTTLFRKAKSDLAEGGTNTLFLAIGFLRWKKTQEDDRSYRAPLLLLPVKLTRKSAQSGFYLVHHEDEVRMNATLLQFLGRDFGIKIPQLEGELPSDDSGVDVPAVLELMRQRVRDVPGFEVVEEIALATFSFAKYLMWKDLVDRQDQLRENRLVRHLIDNPETDFVGTGEQMPRPNEMDRLVAPIDLLTPLPADSSQLSAVVAAAMGHDFVVIGPPGTGKSQTIANMISHCLAKGKSVLFVAEKSAALDVVHRRLCHYGLGEACLELHSNKSDRKSVIGQLGSAWDRATRGSQAEWVKITGDLKIHRDQLNAYVAALHKKGSHGFSVFEAIGETARAPNHFKLSFQTMEAHDAVSFGELADLADEVGRTYAAAGDCTAFSFVTHEDWSYGWEGEVFSATENLKKTLPTLRAAAQPLERELNLPIDPDLPATRLELLSNFSAIAKKTAAADFRIALDAGFEELASGMGELEAAIDTVRSERGLLSARYADDDIARMPLEDLDREWREANAKMWPASALAKKRVAKMLQSYAEAGTADPDTDIAPLRALQSQLGVIARNPLRTTPTFYGPETDVPQMRQFLVDAGDLRNAVNDLSRVATDTAQMSERLSHLIRAGGNRDSLAKIAQDFDQALVRYETALAEFRAVTGDTPQDASMMVLNSTLDNMISQKARLADWTKWVGLRRKAVARGLEPLVEAVENGTALDARAAFRSAYFSWWLPLAMDQSDELRSFAHWDHANKIETFRALDERVRDLTSTQVQRAIAHALPARDGVPRKSELGTLRHQLGLQKPSISIRQLIGQMPKTFTKLTPCVLMSPLSIAQYLPAEQAHFDIVIFDEASQITTWDAIGAIARGKQSIIVGDPKQLPPTNFFGRSTAEDDDDLESYEKDLPSILDEAATAGLPTHQLNWHYRSRDEALIAFSNHHYYGNRLVTFPSPSTGSDALVFHKIDGVYARGEGRFNEPEAKAIAAYAVSRMQSWLLLPEADRQTLGIITFNIQQQALIEDLLDQARRDDPALEWFFEDEREEPVIVKNLENIQGDERDIMLFSITFAPDKAGKFSMNFGALNRDGGEKRLNVAVTRARGELHIFSSVTADKIDLGRTKATGVKHLKNFLDYAERGAIALPGMDEGSLGDAENPFESAVAEALRQKGWEVRTQIGVSGFRIDLGVVHPDLAGAYLAGVECDGATYHSSATARDRDAIREAVLRNLGWEITRVWSTDWFRNAADTCERTDAALRELLEISRKKIAEEAAARAREEEARAAASAAEVEAARTLAEQDRATDLTIVEPEPNIVPQPKADAEPPLIVIPETPRLVAAQSIALPPPAKTPEHAELAKSEPDPERFFDDTYTETLTTLIAEIVASDGPLSETMLVRQISRKHGWQRAGGRIRERVLACLGTCEQHDEFETIFIWEADTHASSIPFRHGLKRPAREISRAEIAGLIHDNPSLVSSEDDTRELANLMGIARLTADTRAYLDDCLERTL